MLHLLVQYDPYNPLNVSPFFDSEWMFGFNGFDVVIGNPPYGGSYSEVEKKYFKENYQSAKTIPNKQKGSLDIFTLFIEQGFDALHKNGCFNSTLSQLQLPQVIRLLGIHSILESNCHEIRISSYAVRPQPIFQNAVVNTSILFFIRTESSW